MIDKLDEVERRYERLEADLANPETLGDSSRLTRVMKERSSLERLVNVYRDFKSVRRDLDEAERMLQSSDPDERALGKEEVPGLRERKDTLEGELKLLLVPKDPNDEKNVILEIRAGAGGDEASLFASEVMQMYLRYADRKGWKSELVDVSAGNAGGIKEATVTLAGDAVYSSMKYESGVHRVQRVPATEAQGRIHTSTVTVAVMPEAEDIDVQVNAADVEMDVFRSTGSGGQSVNTTDSAVRLTHKPTGIVVKCQQEKSQLKNRNMAMRMLRAKLFEIELEKQRSARDAARSAWAA